MKQGYRRLIPLVAGCLIAAVNTWVILPRLTGGDAPKILGVVFAPSMAACMASNVARMFRFSEPLCAAFSAVVVVGGWYCLIALVAGRRVCITGIARICCLLGCVLIWALALLTYMAHVAS